MRTKAATFDQQRGTIREAATRLFAEHGYASASVADIAAACGVSKPLVYHYYRDKEQLLADIAESYIDRLLVIVEQVGNERLPPAAHLRRLIECFMSEYRHSASRHRVLVQDVKFLQRANRARILAKQRRVVQGFGDVIGQLVPAVTAADAAKPLTMILFGMINWTFTWLNDRGPLTYDDMAPIVADLFLGGVGRVRVASRHRISARKPRAARQSPALKAIA